MPGKKVVVVAAINGGMQRDREGAKVPITPAEIAEDALLCYRAGAAIVHIHARDEDGNNSGDPKIYSEAIRRIREKCDILVQTTNGIGVRRNPRTSDFIWPTDDERLALLTIEPRPDIYGIAAGSMDFYHPEGGYPDETPYVNTLHFLRSTLPHVYKLGSTVEFELTDLNVVHRLSRLADEGIISRHASNIWLTFGGGIGYIPPTARALVYSRGEQERVFPNAKWGVLGAGRAQFTVAAMGLAMDCDTVRVGFEDNIYLPNGWPAKRNHDLVEAAVTLARSLGREPATVTETREIFELSHRLAA